MQVQGTFREAITWFNAVTVFDSQSKVGRYRDLEWCASVCDKHDFFIDEFGYAIKWSDNRFSALGFASDNCASFDRSTVFDLCLAAIESEMLFLAGIWGNLNNVVATFFPSRDNTSNSRNVSLTFWRTGFEKLLYTWKTTRDSAGTSHTRRVLGIER